MTPETLALIAVAVAVLALCVAGLALAAQRRTAARYRTLWAGEPKDATAVLAGMKSSLDANTAGLERLEVRTAQVAGDVAQALRHVSVVRYDAFGDMGGRLSFSAALIDDNGDGVVLSSIHARTDSRTYAKAIVSGGSDVTLTPEEQQALAAAKSAG